MKNLVLSIILAIFFASSMSGCSADPNQKANELYVEASQLMQSVKAAEVKSYLELFDLYKNVQKKIEQISARYPSSDVVVGLLSGQIKISGFTLGGFQELGSRLKFLAEAEQNPISCALLLANTIDSKWDKINTLIKVANGYVEAGQKEQAVQVLSQTLEAVNTFDGGRRLLYEIAESYAEAGQFTQALAVANTIDSRWDKSRALAKIASSYIESGQKEQAVQLLSRALKMVNTNGRSRSKDYTLIEIAGSYAKAKQVTQALEVANTINNLIFRYETLGQIAGSCAETGQKEQVVQVLSQALEAVNTLNCSPSHKLHLLVIIASSYIEAGQKEQAVQLLSRALKMVNTSDGRRRLLIDMTGSCAEAGQFTQALAMANKLSYRRDKSDALVIIASSYIEAGQKKQAVQLLSQALKVANTIDLPMNRNGALIKIAGSYAEAKQVTQALEVVNTISSREGKSRALIKIANGYTETGKQLSHKDKAKFRDIVHTEKPMSSFWK